MACNISHLLIVVYRQYGSLKVVLLMKGYLNKILYKESIKPWGSQNNYVFLLGVHETRRNYWKYKIIKTLAFPLNN